MKSVIRQLNLSILIFLFGASWTAAQEREISITDFQTYLKNSIALTKTGSFRRTVTVESGDSPKGGWEPYSSWVSEYIFPDRSHDKYTSGRQGESIWIGNSFYSKSSDGSWSTSRKQTGPAVSSPSSPRGFGDRLVKLYITPSNAPAEGASVVIREISKPKDATADFNERLFYFSRWFFEDGILIKYENIGFNGRNWVRFLEVYDYDPYIRIEAPLK